MGQGNIKSGKNVDKLEARFSLYFNLVMQELELAIKRVLYGPL